LGAARLDVGIFLMIMSASGAQTRPSDRSRSQSAEGGRGLLAESALAVRVDLLEQPAEPSKLADGGGVGAADNGVTESAEPDELRHGETGSSGERADSVLFGGRDANIEALGTPTSAVLRKAT
jgi:hypothetical protein